MTLAAAPRNAEAIPPDLQPFRDELEIANPRRDEVSHGIERVTSLAVARSNIDGTVAITRPRPVLRSMPARAVLAGGISRHGGDCLCWLCRPREAEIRARLAKAEADSDIAMVRCCRRALTGDRDALGAYRAAVELEQLMGGAL